MPVKKYRINLFLTNFPFSIGKTLFCALNCLAASLKNNVYIIFILHYFFMKTLGP